MLAATASGISATSPARASSAMRPGCGTTARSALEELGASVPASVAATVSSSPLGVGVAVCAARLGAAVPVACGVGLGRASRRPCSSVSEPSCTTVIPVHSAKASREASKAAASSPLNGVAIVTVVPSGKLP